MFTSNIQQRKPHRRPKPKRIVRASAKRSALEHVLLRPKARVRLVVRSIRIARARIKSSMADPAYIIERLAWLEA